MILICASCATRYFADEDSIPPQGRTVRCAACGNTWRVERELVLDNGSGPAPATFVDEPQLTREQIERARRASRPPVSSTAQARARQMQRQRLEKFRAAAIAWGGAGAALAALLLVGVVFRQNIAKVWPNTASAYAAVGLGVNITGLEFSDLQITRSTDAAAPSITVTGAVRNIGAQDKEAPVLRFGLRDHNADEVKSWLVSLGGAPIPPGGARQFQSVVVNPPVAAVDIEAAFATPAEAKKAPPPETMQLTPAAAPAPAAKPKAPAQPAPSAERKPQALTIIEPGHGAEGADAEHAAPEVSPGH